MHTFWPNSMPEVEEIIFFCNMNIFWRFIRIVNSTVWYTASGSGCFLVLFPLKQQCLPWYGSILWLVGWSLMPYYDIVLSSFPTANRFARVLPWQLPGGPALPAASFSTHFLTEKDCWHSKIHKIDSRQTSQHNR